MRALPCKTPAIVRPPHLGTTHHDSPGPHTYYLAKIGEVKSVDDFLKNDRLFRFAMKAAGLGDMA